MKYHRGEPDYLARIEAQIDELGLREHVRIVHSLDYDAMPALYRSADVMVSIPPSDATPMALFEAMAAGVPCVVCDIAPLREWVRHGDTGYLVDPLDPVAVATCLERALDAGDQGHALRTRARELAVDRASQSAHMGTMQGLYFALTKGGARQPLRTASISSCS
jgi:glycosyltransferase involved in cell wall biosynthesis